MLSSDTHQGQLLAVGTRRHAVTRDATRVRPWLSELDGPEWRELVGDRLGWRKMLKSTKIRAWPVLQVQDRRWIERTVLR